MQDAVILANHIYDIQPTSLKNIKTALDGYKAERFKDVKEQYPQSYTAAKLMYGHVSNTLCLASTHPLHFDWLVSWEQRKALCVLLLISNSFFFSPTNW